MANIFDLEKQRSERMGAESQKAGTDAIRRRFAQFGGLNSGAALQAEQQLAQDVQQQVGAQQQDVAAKQSNQEFSRAMAEQEARSNRAFAGGEAQKQRVFGAGEAEKGRQFTSGEAQKERDFNKGLQDRDFEFKKEAFALDKMTKLKQMDMERSRFRMEKQADDFNRAAAENEMRRNELSMTGKLREDIFGRKFGNSGVAQQVAPDVAGPTKFKGKAKDGYSKDNMNEAFGVFKNRGGTQFL